MEKGPYQCCKKLCLNLYDDKYERQDMKKYFLYSQNLMRREDRFRLHPVHLDCFEDAKMML